MENIGFDFHIIIFILNQIICKLIIIIIIYLYEEGGIVILHLHFVQ